MWSKLEKLAEQYDCWHLWEKIREKDGVTIYRCKKCGKIKETYLNRYNKNEKNNVCSSKRRW